MVARLMSSKRAAESFWSWITLAIVVRIVADLVGLDRDATAWGIWAVAVVVGTVALAVSWLVLRLREARDLAGGARPLVSAWLSPIVGVAAVLGVAILVGTLF
jgi:putative Mn2+ efflux pump MntP